MSWTDYVWRCTKETAAQKAGFANPNLIIRDGPQPSEFFRPRAEGPPAHCGFSANGPEVRDIAAAVASRVERRLVQPLRRLFVSDDYAISKIGQFASTAQRRIDDALEYWSLRVIARARDGVSAGPVDPQDTLDIVSVSARRTFLRRTRDVFRGSASAHNHEFSGSTRSALNTASTLRQAALALIPEIRTLIAQGDES